MKIVYYITGHGWGHAVRSKEVIRGLLLDNHDVYIVSPVSRNVFSDLLDVFVNVQIRTCEHLDPGGMVQIDPFTPDLEATQLQVVEFMENAGPLIETETAWIKSKEFDLVLSDVPFIPIIGASNAGIPCYIVSNFTWDGIYGPIDVFNINILKSIHDAYNLATGWIRLSGHVPMRFSTDMSVFNVGLIGRKPKMTREDTRMKLGYSASDKVLLVQFGGHALSGVMDIIQEQNWEEMDWKVLVCGSIDDGSQTDFIKHVDRDQYIPDLVGMADVVLCKIGYGTIIEILCSKTPLIYVPRDYFVEQESLVSLLDTYSHPYICMNTCDFKQGRWHTYISKAFTFKRPEYTPKLAGVSEILQIIGN